MPKQTYKIESFHGGLNSNADPRDIKDDEASKLQNVKISKLGRLKTSGIFQNISVGSATTILNNRGLFSFKSDRKLDGTLSNETFLALYDDNDSAIDISDSDGFDDSVITTFDSDLPVFYVGDGNLRVGDGEFDNAINNKFFGYIEENRFDSLNASLERFEQITVACIEDESGSLNQRYFDIYGADNHKILIWIDIDNSGSSQPTGSGSYIHNIEVTGIATDDNANTVATQVAASINANSEFSASADTNTVTITLIDSNEKTDAHAGNSGFTVSVVTTGNPLGWKQSNQSVDKPTLGHCLISTPEIGSDSNGVNSSASEYIGDVAEGASGDVGDPQSVNLRAGLQYNELLPNAHGDWTGTHVNLATETTYYPLIGNVNVKATSSATQPKSVVVDTGQEFSINEEQSFVMGFYITASEYADLKRVNITCHTTDSDGGDNVAANYRFTKEELISDAWNLLVCSINNTTGGEYTFGDTLTRWVLQVVDGDGSSASPTFWLSGPVLAKNSFVSGFQPGIYQFYYSYLYDGEKQESLPFKFIDIGSGNVNKLNVLGESVLFNFDTYINPYNVTATTYNISERITGSRVYYKVEENDNYYLIGEIDFINKGFKWLPEGLEMDYNMSNTSNTGNNWLKKCALIKKISPDSANLIDTFKTINGYGATTKSINAKYKTAVIHGRRSYIGNVRQDGKNFPDRMLKSLVNKFDVFPDTVGRIDVAINDGESIVKLEAFADRILQFKENNLYIINVSENVDFLEDTLVGKGCAFDYHSTKTDFGIAWFNKFGVYFFDGRQVLNLLEKDGRRLISEDDWETFITDGEQLSTFSSNTVTFSDTHPANTSTLTFQVGSEQTKTIQFLNGAGTNELAFQVDHIADTYVDNFLDSNFAESLCEHVTGIVNSMSNLSATNNGDVMTVTADTATSSKNITIGSSGSHNTTIGTVISGSTGDGNPNDLTTASAHIGYIPRSREIFIKNKNGDSYMYDFVLRAWVYGYQLFLDFGNNTNFALNGDQDLIYICSSNKRTLKWNINSTSAGAFIYATKDIDFGQPHVRKKIYKVYVSYTSDGSGTVPLYYSVDGDTSLNTVAGAVSGMALNKSKWTVAEYKFNNDAKSCNSIRLQFGTGSAGAGFEINDITIVYRLKNAK